MCNKFQIEDSFKIIIYNSISHDKSKNTFKTHISSQSLFLSILPKRVILYELISMTISIHSIFYFFRKKKNYINMLKSLYEKLCFQKFV